MNIDKLSDAAKVTTFNEICDGLKTFAKNNPEAVPDLLNDIVHSFLNPIAEDDGFGTEGWEHCFGIE